MAIAFRIMVFVLVANLAAGMVNFALSPYTTDVKVKYDSGLDTMSEFKGYIPGADAEDQGGWMDKFVDFLRIGIFEKIAGILKNSIYGIVGLLTNHGIITVPEYAYYLNLGINIIYALGIVDIYTGRKVQN